MKHSRSCMSIKAQSSAYILSWCIELIGMNESLSGASAAVVARGQFELPAEVPSHIHCNCDPNPKLAWVSVLLQ